MLTQISAQKLSPILLCEMDFLSGTTRLWNGVGSITWGGQTYTGAGQFGSVSPVEESTDISAKGITLSLNGIPSDIIAIALLDDYQGRAAKVWLGALNSSGAIVTDPIQIFGGRMDVMSISDSGDTGSISLTAENRLIDLNRARERRFTDEDQQIDFPGDKGFEFVAGIQDKPIYWGVPGQSSPAWNPPAVDYNSYGNGQND
jgi:hypothetical protein